MLKKIFWIIIILLSLAIMFYFLKPQPIKVEIVKITKADFQNFIRQDGIARAIDRAIVTSPASGVLEKINLKVGDPVKKGQTLAIVQWNSPMRVRSNMTGFVSKVFRDSAGPIERSQSLLEIVDNSKIEVVADFLTTEAVQLKGNEKVSIEKWGGDFPLEGHVKHVEPMAFTKVSSLGVEEQRVNVVIDIDTEKSKWKSLKDSFHVECRILVKEIKNAWQIPVGTLFRQGDGWFVFVVENKKAQTLPVIILDKNNSMAVLDFDHMTDESQKKIRELSIINFPPTDLKPGQTVEY